MLWGGSGGLVCKGERWVEGALGRKGATVGPVGEEVMSERGEGEGKSRRR